MKLPTNRSGYAALLVATLAVAGAQAADAAGGGDRIPTYTAELARHFGVLQPATAPRRDAGRQRAKAPSYAAELARHFGVTRAPFNVVADAGVKSRDRTPTYPAELARHFGVSPAAPAAPRQVRLVRAK